MLISIDKLKALYSEFDDINEELLKRKLSAIENAIVSYTQNQFTNRYVNELVYMKDNKLMYAEEKTHYLTLGDTIRISEPKNIVNIFNITNIDDEGFVVDGYIYYEGLLNARKVEYPIDIVEGAINILKWDIFERDKHEGITSESISRHSVSYETLNASNTINGYPSRLFGFCTPYTNKVRTWTK